MTATATSFDMNERATRSAWWVAGNVLAILAYLCFSSQTWLEPELRSELVATSGDAVVWALSALPVLVVTLVVDLSVLVWALVQRQRRSSWPFASWSWTIVAAWLVAYAIDRYHR